MTTLAVAIPSGAAPSSQITLPTPTVPAGATQTPTVSGFNLEPFSSIIQYANDATGGFGMPIGNAWQMLYTIGMVFCGVVVYVRLRNFFLAWTVLFLLTIFGVGLHLVQGYLVVFEILIGAGVFAIDKFAQ
jgi:hypothetical protein